MHFPKQKNPKNEKIIGLQRQVGQDILPKIPGWFKPIDECFHKRVIFFVVADICHGSSPALHTQGSTWSKVCLVGQVDVT